MAANTDSSPSSYSSNVSSSSSTSVQSQVPFGSSLNPEVTVFIILTGILVGLLLVVVVLCICKCCLRTNKPLKRQHVVFTKYSSERESPWDGCTKYHSMEQRGGGGGAEEATPTTPSPRVAPSTPTAPPTPIPTAPLPSSSSSALLHTPPIDDTVVEMGDQSDICNRGGAEEEPEVEKAVFPVSGLSSSEKVFQKCSKEFSSPEDISFLQKTMLLRFPFAKTLPLLDSEDLSVSRRFPRSPPIRRQSSFCITGSDEDEAGKGEVVGFVVGRGASGMKAVSLASPEGSTSASSSASFEGQQQQLLQQIHLPEDSGTNIGEKTKISAEIHQAPRSPPTGHALLFPPLLATDSGSSAHGARPRSTWSLVEPSSTSAKPDDAGLLRPSSATDLRLGRGGSSKEEEQELQHAASTEDGALLNRMMEIRSRTNGSCWRKKGRGGSAASRDPPSEDEDEEPRSKVRYNDTGSMEEVDDEAVDAFLVASSLELLLLQDSPPGEDVAEEEEQKPSEAEMSALEQEELQQYRQLWELRATFEEEDSGGRGGNGDNGGQEEEEEEEDVERPPEEKEELEESGIGGSEKEEEEEEEEQGNERQAKSLDWPSCSSYASSRRQSYKEVFERRVSKKNKKKEDDTDGTPSPIGQGVTPPCDGSPGMLKPCATLTTRPSGVEHSSFDSIETEGSSIEMVTTSMESTTTTDNTTDSAGGAEGNGGGGGNNGQGVNRLQQMKADSGYKSLETNNNNCMLAGASADVKLQQRSLQQQQLQWSSMPSTSSATVAMVLPDVTVVDGASNSMATELQTEGKTAEWTRNLSLGGSGRIAGGGGSRVRWKDVGSPSPSRSGCKSASKKRKEYIRGYEKQRVQVMETSFIDYDLDSPRSEDFDHSLPSSSSSCPRGPKTVFLRFFNGGGGAGDSPSSTMTTTVDHYHQRPSSSSSTLSSRVYHRRDFSIDEKSDALFREFSRRDPALEDSSGTGLVVHRRIAAHVRHHHHHHYQCSAETGVMVSSGGGMELATVSDRQDLPSSSKAVTSGSPHRVHGQRQPPQCIEEEEHVVQQNGDNGGGGNRQTIHIPIIKVATEDSS